MTVPEQIVVGKGDLFRKYKPLLESIFSTDYSSMTLEGKKEDIFSRLALEVYRSIPYDHTQKDLGGDKILLSELEEGVCRHQSLTFQVLCQLLGVKSCILKSYLDGARHSTNAVRLDGVWYIFDVTNPDYVEKADGSREWRPGAYKTEKFPGEAGVTHKVIARHSRVQHEYAIHDDMFWRIDDVSKAL